MSESAPSQPEPTPGRVRRFLYAPLFWWAKERGMAPVLERSAWEHGKAAAAQAARSDPLFAFVATVVTLAVPTAVGFAGHRLPAGFQVALIVLSGAVGYVTIPVVW